MPSATERALPQSRRLLARFAPSFASSSRHITDFSIHFDNEHKQYSSGDIVTGHIRLRVARAVRVTHLVIRLHGFVQVYKNPSSPDEGSRASTTHLSTARGKRGREYHGNGFASLFEDDQVLCGDGRLAEGEYQFQFELEFPTSDLPSSIEFERGVISYMVTATLTRPTSISPTITCDRRIPFVETIDISTLAPPKSRTIELHALSKRARTKKAGRTLPNVAESQSSNSVHEDSDTPRRSDASSGPSTHVRQQGRSSPVLSELSLDSPVTRSRRTSQAESQLRGSVISTPVPSDISVANSSKSVRFDKTITATIESMAGGCLQGDYIPIKVNVTHTKPIRSVYGVIVTLFRQARVDIRPAIPLGPIEKGSEGRGEDYYPKSLTGLGGLSLSGTSSSHVFRKDLTQAMGSLFVDPSNLTAEVNTKVYVPSEAFPTISCVPGAMISFRYYVEVIVDIQAKLQGLEKAANNLSGQAPPAGHYLNAESSVMERSAFTPFGSTIIDTTPIRRDKGVVTCTFEVVIGTKDSERRKGKRVVVDTIPEPTISASQTRFEEQAMAGADALYPPEHWHGNDEYYNDQWYEAHGYGYTSPHEYHPSYYDQAYQEASVAQPLPLPLPQLPDESEMSEKERIRRAETRLLPSQPPGLEDAVHDSVIGATAPYLPEEMDNPRFATVSQPAPDYNIPHPSGPLTTASGTVGEASSSQFVSGSTAGATNGHANEPRAVNEDCQHLPIREGPTLVSTSSAGVPNGLGPSTITYEASAPTRADIDGLLIDDMQHSHADAIPSVGLPKYER